MPYTGTAGSGYEPIETGYEASMEDVLQSRAFSPLVTNHECLLRNGRVYIPPSKLDKRFVFRMVMKFCKSVMHTFRQNWKEDKQQSAERLQEEHGANPGAIVEAYKYAKTKVALAKCNLTETAPPCVHLVLTGKKKKIPNNYERYDIVNIILNTANAAGVDAKHLIPPGVWRSFYEFLGTNDRRSHIDSLLKGKAYGVRSCYKMQSGPGLLCPMGDIAACAAAMNRPLPPIEVLHTVNPVYMWTNTEGGAAPEPKRARFVDSKGRSAETILAIEAMRRICTAVPQMSPEYAVHQFAHGKLHTDLLAVAGASGTPDDFVATVETMIDCMENP